MDESEFRKECGKYNDGTKHENMILRSDILDYQRWFEDAEEENEVLKEKNKTLKEQLEGVTQQNRKVMEEFEQFKKESIEKYQEVLDLKFNLDIEVMNCKKEIQNLMKQLDQEKDKFRRLEYSIQS